MRLPNPRGAYSLAEFRNLILGCDEISGILSGMTRCGIAGCENIGA